MTINGRLVLVALGLLAMASMTACSAGRATSKAAGPASPKPASATTSVAPTPTASSPSAAPSSSAANQIKVQLAGIPPTITAGQTISFTATMTNTSGTTLSDVAPLFQIVGGPCNCAQGSLERLDSASGLWQTAPMPEGDGEPDYLAFATGPVTLLSGSAVSVQYRLTLSALNSPKPLYAVLYAVQLPAGTQLAITSIPTQFVAGS